MTENTATPAAETRPMGAETESHVYRPNPDVVGDVEQSHSGNSILRVGTYYRAERHWMQSAYIVLTPRERERLIAALIEHRDHSPAPDAD